MIASLMYTLGIRRAASWYNMHVQQIHTSARPKRSGPPSIVVMLSDDVENRKRAEQENLTAISGTHISPLCIGVLTD